MATALLVRRTNPRGLKSFLLAMEPIKRHESHFEESDHAKIYSLFRPVPPKSLVAQIADFTKVDKALAVDVGCGSGQSSLVLAPHFAKVVGLDISESQIKEARENSHEANLEFRVSDSNGGLDFEDASVSAVTACQAIHWFDIPRFYSESRRILVPGGVLAVYGYHFTDVSPVVENHEKLNRLRDEFYAITKPFWSSRRRLVDEGYKTLPAFAFENHVRYKK